MFLFDWRMGAACLLAAVISMVAMFSMMGGKNAKLMAEYQAAQDRMTKAGTEYVRGVPVVKIFQQTVYSFKSVQRRPLRITAAKAGYYQDKDVPRSPIHQSNVHRRARFVFWFPSALFLAPRRAGRRQISPGSSQILFSMRYSPLSSLRRWPIMFASAGTMLAHTALGRIDQVMDAPPACSRLPTRRSPVTTGWSSGM